MRRDDLTEYIMQLQRENDAMQYRAQMQQTKQVQFQSIISQGSQFYHAWNGYLIMSMMATAMRPDKDSK